MKRLLLTLAAIAMLAAPASALTLDQAMSEVAGMHCSGSTCTSSETITTTIQNPDIVTVTETYIDGSPISSGQVYDHCTMGVMFPKTPGARVAIPNVNADCTPQSIAPLSGGSILRATTVEPGGTSTIETCQTTTKRMTYNGPNTSRDMEWSVDTSISSTSGAC